MGVEGFFEVPISDGGFYKARRLVSSHRPVRLEEHTVGSPNKRFIDDHLPS